MKKLKPPKNLRDTTPKCCATCKHAVVSGFEPGEQYLDCERQEGTLGSDETIYSTVCDYYKKT